MIQVPKYAGRGNEKWDALGSPLSNARAMHVHLIMGLCDRNVKPRELMIKKPFTTRLDPKILELAQQLAKAERRSVTAIIELALMEYAENHPTEKPDRDRQTAG